MGGRPTNGQRQSGKQLIQHREQFGHVAANRLDIGEGHQRLAMRDRIAQLLQAIELQG